MRGQVGVRASCATTDDGDDDDATAAADDDVDVRGQVNV